MKPGVSLLVDVRLLELDVRPVEPVPEAQPSVAGVESEIKVVNSVHGFGLAKFAYGEWVLGSSPSCL